MKILKENFDDFNIHARIMPALIIAMPVYIYLNINKILELNFINILGNSMVFIILITFYYRIIRNLGKRIEEKMYFDLGNKPTTIVLQYRDTSFDELTKIRYHKKLNKKVEGIKLPIKKENETGEDDKAYESAINWLRNFANTHRDTEQRTYQELKDYNFWRNLYGGKAIMIISCLTCILVELIKIILLNSKEFHQIYPNVFTMSIMLFILLMVCLVINKNVIKMKAFDYARTLLEVCERI